MDKFRHWRWYRYMQPVLVTAGVVTFALAAYWPTVAPSITWRNGGSDGGDLAAAVATLGVPHPPGYPGYVLLGRLWAALPLGGDVAYRLNLFSAAGAAAAAGLAALAILLLARKIVPCSPAFSVPVGALFGGLSLSLAPLTWSQATIAEIYAPGLATFSLISLCLLYGWYTGSPWSLLLAGLAGGFGLGISPQIVLLLPGTALWLFFWEKRHVQGNSWQSWGWLAPLLLGFGLGLTVFVYLPIRAAAQPLINWGDPETPARFWAVVSMAQYQQYASLLDAQQWPPRLLESIIQLGQQLSWAGLGLALLGGYVLWNNDRVVLGYLIMLVGLAVLFRTGYPVMNNLVYLLPALYGLAVMAGVGAVWLLSQAGKQVGGGGAALLGAGVLIALVVRATNIAPLVDISADRSAVLFGQRTMAHLAPNAVIISERDETTFSLWYQQALNQRPDVVVLDSRLFCFDWYRRNLAHRYPDLDPVVARPDLITTVARPLYELVGPSGEELAQSIEDLADCCDFAGCGY